MQIISCTFSKFFRGWQPRTPLVMVPRIINRSGPFHSQIVAVFKDSINIGHGKCKIKVMESHGKVMEFDRYSRVGTLINTRTGFRLAQFLVPLEFHTSLHLLQDCNDVIYKLVPYSFIHICCNSLFVKGVKL